eukprot:TRINITY_DN54315_c0_g1_i1.p3 TRINITY_DN54315_c0_g1~~TRINITY_DN54315_c0_g1_i1.p3  ORF type:complete len:241 (-),score=40.99 TRINITY_DN54315_c0_g1_i1:310-1032(-)
MALRRGCLPGMALSPARVAAACSDAGGSAVTRLCLETPARVPMKDILREVRQLVAAADIGGGLEVLDSLIADEDVDKHSLDMAKWTQLSFTARKRKALALIGADAGEEAMAPTYEGTAKRPGLAMRHLPQLDLRCPETADILHAKPPSAGRARPVSGRARSTSFATARSTVASSPKATPIFGICPAVEEAHVAESRMSSARKRPILGDLKTHAFTYTEDMDDPFQNRMEVGSTGESYFFS